MAVTYQTATSATSADGGSSAQNVNVNPPGSLAAGDLWVLWVVADTDGSTTVINTPSGFTAAHDKIYGANDGWPVCRTFYKIAGASESAVNVSTDSGTYVIWVASIRCSGQHATAPIGNVGINTPSGPGSTCDAPDITIQNDGSLALLFYGGSAGGPDAITEPTGTTFIVKRDGGVFPEGSTAYQTQDAGSYAPGNWTISSNNNEDRLAVTIEILPAAGGGGSTYSLALDSVALTAAASDLGLLSTKVATLEAPAVSLAISDLTLTHPVGYSLTLGSAAMALAASDLGMLLTRRAALDAPAMSLAISGLGFTVTVLADSITMSAAVSDLGLKFNRTLALEASAAAVAASDLGLRYSRRIALGAPAETVAVSDLGLVYVSGYGLILGPVAMALAISDLGLGSTGRLALDSVAIASDASDLGLRMGRKIALGVPSVLLGSSDLGLRYGRLLGLEAAAASLGASDISLRYSAAPTSFPLDAVGVSVGTSALGLLVARQLTLAGADVTLAIGDLGLSPDIGLDTVPTTPLDGPLRKVAEKLIAKFGKQIVLRFVTTGSYDTSTRTYSSSTADQTVRALLESPGLSRRAYGESGPGGSRSQEWKITLAARGLTREPTPADLIVIGDQEMEITGVDPTYAGGLPALYQLRVKR